MKSAWIFANRGRSFVLLLGALFTTFLQADPQPEEMIRILFRCGKPEELGKPSFQELKASLEDSLLRENGKLYFFQFPIEPGFEGSREYSFHNGVFLRSGSEFAEPSLESERKLRNYQFVIQYNPQGYETWKDYSSPTTLRIWIVPDPIPNGLRRYGNTLFLSCPVSIREIGDLRMVFRGSRLIRQHFQRMVLENWLGDLE